MQITTDCSTEIHNETQFKYHYVTATSQSIPNLEEHILCQNIIGRNNTIRFSINYFWRDIYTHSPLSKCKDCKFALMMVARKCPSKNRYENNLRSSQS